jgi:putative ATP-dependent endonuclease of OLD family
MHIDEVSIENFRLLQNVALHIEEVTTVIVGRNNSGKTSLTELFRRLLSGKAPVFSLEDFSLEAHEGFWNAFKLKHDGKEEDEVRKALPAIRAKLTVKYDVGTSSLGQLGEFIVDLDMSCTSACIEVSYRLDDGKIGALFEGLPAIDKSVEEQQRREFFRAMKERVPKLYRAELRAVDPQDAANFKTIEWQRLQSLVQSGFINAQRGLDDTTHKANDVLGKILEALFETSSSELSAQADRDVADKLEKAVQSIQTDIDEGFNKHLQDLLPAFELFGYPGLHDPNLCTETTLNVERLLTNYTAVRYAGANGMTLPEAYNGLGARNLIYILLRLLEFFKAFKASPVAPGVHLVFIEEPEAHLHPQMSEVFIRKLGEIADVFSAKFNDGVPWPVQFVVTTHSTHMANEAPFEAMRYFMVSEPVQLRGARSTKVKDLRAGLGGEKQADRDFLHQYMTLTRCDLLFADKAVLIEGPSERLLLPSMVAKLDAMGGAHPKLSSQYLSVLEVGGAYAHRFFKLLDFLELRTLLVSDLDPAKKNAGNRWESCNVSEGTGTTNGCIKDWFNATITPAELIAKTADEKTRGVRRLAYQVPEAAGGACGHTLEDAFILANPQLFPLPGVTNQEREAQARQAASDEKKPAFALKHALEVTDWSIPRYIAEGLRWLADNPIPAGPVPPPATIPPEANAPVGEIAHA